MRGTFLCGCALYPLIELAWRGRTHPAMALAGGASLCWLRRIAQARPDWPLALQALAGGLGITALEYAVGRAFNRRYHIWDYRRMPLNVHGQICPAFTLAWCGLSAAAFMLGRWARGFRSYL